MNKNIYENITPPDWEEVRIPYGNTEAVGWRYLSSAEKDVFAFTLFDIRQLRQLYGNVPYSGTFNFENKLIEILHECRPSLHVREGLNSYPAHAALYKVKIQ